MSFLSPREAFLDSRLSAFQGRESRLTGGRFKSECAWAEAGESAGVRDLRNSGCSD